jgi:hypothetical protein
MPNIDIENYVEQNRWDYSNEYNKWEGGVLDLWLTLKSMNRLITNYETVYLSDG